MITRDIDLDVLKFRSLLLRGPLFMGRSDYKGYRCRCRYRYRFIIWVVVKLRVPFWVLDIVRHLVFKGPKRGL